MSQCAICLVEGDEPCIKYLHDVWNKDHPYITKGKPRPAGGVPVKRK